jgi:hypothetical protein
MSLLLPLVIGCGRGPSPAPSPTPDASVPSTPDATFAIALPVRDEDRARNAFGLNPFGIHIGDHGFDGHPGWDIEYRAGANVLAAADGIVQSVLPSEGGQAFGIQITHRVSGRDAYRTIYGVRTLAPAVSVGASVTARQPLGTAASYTRTIGTVTVTYAFTHFQLDDFSSNHGATNPNAVSPETFLNSEARRVFDAIWPDAFYPQELVEPFATNPRDVTFPMTRAWVLQAGGLAPRLEFTRADAFANGYTYVMRDGTGAIVESGRVEVEALAKPVSTIDFTPTGSAQQRRGVYSIVDETMRLDYGPSGTARPTSLAAASTYTTER